MGAGAGRRTRGVIILAFDTATRRTAVALLDGERLLAECSQPAGSHSKTLLFAVDELLRSCGVERGRLEGVAVGIGPGSFTGVRIGLTVAKTLAFARDVPLAGVSSLRALAENGVGLGDQVCPALDALKSEVYCARYAAEGGGLDRLVEVEPADARDPRAWAAKLAGEAGTRVLLGSGLERYRTLFDIALGDRLVVPGRPELHRISAAALGRLAMERFVRGEADDPRSLEPMYCRLSEAELARSS